MREVVNTLLTAAESRRQGEDATSALIMALYQCERSGGSVSDFWQMCQKAGVILSEKDKQTVLSAYESAD